MSGLLRGPYPRLHFYFYFSQEMPLALLASCLEAQPHPGSRAAPGISQQPGPTGCASGLP